MSKRPTKPRDLRESIAFNLWRDYHVTEGTEEFPHMHFSEWIRRPKWLREKFLKKADLVLRVIDKWKNTNVTG